MRRTWRSGAGDSGASLPRSVGQSCASNASAEHTTRWQAEAVAWRSHAVLRPKGVVAAWAPVGSLAPCAASQGLSRSSQLVPDAAALTTAGRRPPPPCHTRTPHLCCAPSPCLPAPQVWRDPRFLPSCFYFCFFAQHSTLFPYQPLYFRRLGLSEQQIGLIAALRPWVSFPSGKIVHGCCRASL